MCEPDTYLDSSCLDFKNKHTEAWRSNHSPCCQKLVPEVGDGLLTEKRIKEIILEHYPCFDEEEEYHIVELEKAIAQAQQAFQQGPSLEEVLAVIEKLIGYKALTYSYIHAELTALFAQYPKKAEAGLNNG